MIVLWKNRMWSLDMSYCLFKMLQKQRPNEEVDLTELTGSTYKEIKKAPIGEVNDYSVERNLRALGQN